VRRHILGAGDHMMGDHNDSGIKKPLWPWDRAEPTRRVARSFPSNTQSTWNIDNVNLCCPFDTSLSWNVTWEES
jgi:hypothetical protein